MTVEHGIVVRFQLVECPMFDGTFSFIMRDPCTSLRLFVSMVANLNKALNHIIEGIVVVVVKQQAFLLFDQLFGHHIGLFLFFIHVKIFGCKSTTFFVFKSNYLDFSYLCNLKTSIGMQNRFIKNIIFLLFLNLLVKPFWILGIDLEVQNILGDALYGQYLSIFNFSYLFYILLDLGITNFNSRNIASDNKMLSTHFAGLAEIKLLLGVFYAVIIFIVGYLNGFREGFQLKMLFWCGLNQILLSFVLFLRSNMQGLLLFKADSLLSVFDRVLSILLMALLLWSGWFSLERFNVVWYLQVQTTAYLCTIALALFLVLKHVDHLSFKVNLKFIKGILSQSFPFALLVLLMSVYSRIEPFLLERLLDDNGVQAGIYGRAYRLFDAGNNISNLFAIMLLPMFTATLKNKMELGNLVKTSFNVMVAMTGIVLIMCVFYSQDIMQLMYHRPEPGETEAAYLMRIGQYSKVFPILMGSFFCLSTTYIFGTLLTANGSLKQLNMVAAAGVVINILLNLIVIPKFQSRGAACTSLCVQTVTAVAQYIICEKIFKLNLGWRYWIHIALFLGSVVLCTYLTQMLQMDWKISFGIGFVINVGLIFITKLLSLKDILSLILPNEKR